MQREVIQARLNIQGVSVTTYYGDKAIEKAEQYLRDNYHIGDDKYFIDPPMRVYLEVIYQLSG